jgi:predicted O-methyltransferase YrrM
MNELFKHLWAESQEVPMVTQEPNELYAAFCLMRGYSSFLEVGSCYGTSLYILSHALRNGSRVVSVDLGEEKSVSYLEGNLQKLKNKGFDTKFIKGNSREVKLKEKFDVVFIDGDHSYEGVKADVEKYRPLCKHLLLLHDIRMDGPGRVLTEIGGGLRINYDYSVKHAPDTGFGVQMIKSKPSKSDNQGLGAQFL